MSNECGHEAKTFDHQPLTCDLPKGHDGLHEQTDELLYGGTQRTNWRDDGKAPWAPVASPSRVAAMREP